MVEPSQSRAQPLSVVIPVHNEAECIGTLIGEIERALPASGGEIIVVDDASDDATPDGDGQNDPADIPRLLSAYAAAAGGDVMVCGQRRRRRDSWIKRFASRVANGVRSRLLGDGVPDTGCGLKVFPRDLFLRLPWFDHMHRFLPALVLREGGRVEKVEVNHRPRAGGRTKYGIHNRLWAGIVDLLGVLWLQRRGNAKRIREME